ncbi:hypothetical protein ACNOYE_38170 [Nannocystaceae bacterium ST9]
MRSTFAPLALALFGSTSIVGCAGDSSNDDEVGETGSDSSTTATDELDDDATANDAETTSDSSSDTSTTDTTDTATTDTGDEPESVPGCDDSSFYAVPADPAERGPWAVGARQVTIDGLNTEIWYPAAWASDAGQDPKTYDIRYALPESEQAKITDDKNPLQVCDCYDQLPIDDQHGPYPVVVFIHGTASWRSQSLTQMTHWASRGFVVISSDHPGLWLADTLGLACGTPGGQQNLSGDTDSVLAAIANPSGELEFLAGLLDTSRLAISGHSAGASAAANQASKPDIRVSIPMAGGAAVAQGPALESALFLGGQSDGVVAYTSTQNAYMQSMPSKRLVGLSNAGHLAFSDICEIENADGQNILEIAVEAGVCGAQFAGFLFDCDPTFLDAQIAGDIINYSSTAVLEQVLKCVQGPDLFAEFEATYPDVGEYQAAL